MYFIFQKKKEVKHELREPVHKHTQVCTLLMTRIMPCLGSNVSTGIKAAQIMAKDKEIKA